MSTILLENERPATREQGSLRPKTIADLVPLPDLSEFQATVDTAAKNIGEAIVDSDFIYAEVGETLATGRKLKARINDLRLSVTRVLDDRKAEIMQHVKPILDQLDRIDATANTKLRGYLKQKEDERREEQRKLDEAARQERERLAAQQRAAQAAIHSTQDEAVRERLQTEATELAVQAEMVTPTIAAPAVPKVAGLGSSKVKTYTVDDFPAVVAYLLANPALLGWLTLDMAKVKAYYKTLGASASIPGITVGEDSSFRRGR